MNTQVPEVLPLCAPGEEEVNRPTRRVLHVFDSLGVGGAETWLVALLEWLAHNGERLPVVVQMDVCLTSGKRAVLDDRVQALGAKLHYIRYERRHLRSFRRDFRRLLRDGHYDAIHDHADYAAGIHLLCGVGELPPARVVHVHNALDTFSPSFPKRFARAVGRRAVARLATTVAGTSMRVLVEYDLAPKAGAVQRRRALHCGFDLEPFAADANHARADVRAEFGWDADSRILLFVGRFESHFPQKNPQLALEVARECMTRDRSVRALFVGAGETVREELIAQTTSWGLAHAFQFPGLRFDVPRLMLGSNLLLFPSIAEGLGMVAVEAQAAGLRVLASDTTPRECEVVPGMVAFIPLTESAARWADMALALLEEPSPDNHFCREIVGRSPFSIENSIRALLEVYGFGQTAPS